MKGAAMSDKKCPNCFYELDSWNDYVSFNNILECPECEEHFELKAVTLNQPQLTIPKSIADIIDVYCKHNFTADRLIMMAYRDYQEFNDWIIKDWVKNDNIARAYLAGKALGVDVVKVVEG
jgi:hypothetical protein